MKNHTIPWKILSAVMAVALVAVSVGWAMTANRTFKPTAEKQPASTADTVSAMQHSSVGGENRKLIIDTDSGADDASALIMAAKDENIEILGVTVSEGNVSLQQAVDTALMTLEMTGSDAPVYAGAETTYTGKHRDIFSVFGKDGMGDQKLIHPTRKAADGNAVDFILDTVKSNPGEVEIVALGPVTNLARAFDKDPETMKKVRRYWSMGTTGFGNGNATPVAEFNVYHDAEAYKVFTESGVPITALGLDMMDDEVLMPKTWLDRLEEKGGLSEFVAKSFSGLVSFNLNARGAAVADNPDSVCMACVLWDGFMQETEECHASVQTLDNETYGEVILYKKGYGYDTGVTFDDYSFSVVTKINSKILREKLEAVLAE